MPKVLFTATEDVPNFLYKKGYVARAPFGDGTTVKVYGPVVLEDGDVVEMDDFEALWCVSVSPYKQSFKILDLESEVEPSKVRDLKDFKENLAFGE